MARSFRAGRVMTSRPETLYTRPLVRDAPPMEPGGSYRDFPPGPFRHCEPTQGDGQSPARGRLMMPKPDRGRLQPGPSERLAYRDHHQRRYCKSARSVSMSLCSSVAMPSTAPVITRQSLIILRLVACWGCAPRCARMVTESLRLAAGWGEGGQRKCPGVARSTGAFQTLLITGA